MSEKFVIDRTTHGRWRTNFSPGVACEIRLLAEDHPRRVAKNIRAFVVLDITSDIMVPGEEGKEVPATVRIRDIEVVYHSDSKRYLVRYKQWRTGKFRDGQDEYLDVAGPANRETRGFFREQILAFFHQLREEASQGTLGRRQNRTSESLGSQPALRQQLEGIAERLDRAEEQAQPQTEEEETPEPQETSA